MPAPVQAADDVGFIAGRTMDVVVLPKIAGAPIAKGAVIEYVAASDAWRTAAAGSVTSIYAVAVKPALTADTKVEAISSGAVTVRADGAIGVGAPVKVSAATAGEVQESALTGTPDAFSTVVGQYMGKVGANIRNGMTVTNAADNDVIIIDLNRRTG